MKRNLVATVTPEGKVSISGHGNVALQDKQIKALAYTLMELMTNRVATGAEVTGIQKIDELQTKVRCMSNSLMLAEKQLKRSR